MKAVIISIILALMLSCNGQAGKKANINNTKTNTMEKFDINKFEKLEKDNYYSSTKDELFYKIGDKRYRISFYEEIDVEETSINNPYLFYKVYFKVSKKLKAVGKLFYNIPVEISKEYNENGDMIKETDYDKNYNFSIEDLEKKMKQEYNVNIMDTKQTRSVNRSFTDSRIKFPYYQVVVNSGIASFTDYLINGTTGELFFTLKTMRGDEKDVIEEYHKTIKK